MEKDFPKYYTMHNKKLRVLKNTSVKDIKKKNPEIGHSMSLNNMDKEKEYS